MPKFKSTGIMPVRWPADTPIAYVEMVIVADRPTNADELCELRFCRIDQIDDTFDLEETGKEERKHHVLSVELVALVSYDSLARIHAAIGSRIERAQRGEGGPSGAPPDSTLQ